jgi:hypothetical protein
MIQLRGQAGLHLEIAVLATSVDTVGVPYRVVSVLGA